MDAAGVVLLMLGAWLVGWFSYAIAGRWQLRHREQAELRKLAQQRHPSMRGVEGVVRVLPAIDLPLEPREGGHFRA